MKPYRKPDQYYIDKYDRATIKELKEIEIKEKRELEAATVDSGPC